MHSTILLIEDSEEMSEFLREILVEQGYVVYVASSGVQGLKLVDKVHPDLILLDLLLPDIHGGSLCVRIKKNYPELPIIMVTGQTKNTEIVTGLNQGADDYILKPFDESVLFARIRARLRLGNQISVLRCSDLELNQETHQVLKNGTDISLSAQEFRLLEYLLLNQGKVVTRNMCVSRLWNCNPDIDTRVVDVYIGYLRKKVDPEGTMLKTIRGFGYSLKS